MAGRLHNIPRANVRGFKWGGNVSSTRTIDGIKAPRNGVSPKVMDMAKGSGRAEGITGDDGIGADGVPVKTSLARPGRKFGGRTGKPHKDADGDYDGDKYAKGGRLSAKERHALPKKDFALAGERYPIEDKSHARNALARVSGNGSPEEKTKVRAAVHRKYPGIGKD